MQRNPVRKRSSEKKRGIKQIGGTTLKLVKFKNKAWRKWCRNRTVEVKNEYMGKKSEFQKVVGEEKREKFTQEFQKDTNGNKKMFYSITKNKRKNTETTTKRK